MNTLKNMKRTSQYNIQLDFPKYATVITVDASNDAIAKKKALQAAKVMLAAALLTQVKTSVVTPPGYVMLTGESENREL
jgi:hypothetical protein